MNNENIPENRLKYSRMSKIYCQFCDHLLYHDMQWDTTFPLFTKKKIQLYAYKKGSWLHDYNHTNAEIKLVCKRMQAKTWQWKRFIHTK